MALWCINTLAGFSVNLKTVLWEIGVIVARRNIRFEKFGNCNICAVGAGSVGANPTSLTISRVE